MTYDYLFCNKMIRIIDFWIKIHWQIISKSVDVIMKWKESSRYPNDKSCEKQMDTDMKCFKASYLNLTCLQRFMLCIQCWYHKKFLNVENENAIENLHSRQESIF